MSEIYEMANLSRKETKLPFDLWADSAGEQGINKHNGIRVKARCNDTDIIAGFDSNGNYTNFKTPEYKIKKFKENKKLEEYLVKIKPILELHWKNEMTDREFLNAAVLVSKGEDINKAIDIVCDRITSDTLQNEDSNIKIENNEELTL